MHRKWVPNSGQLHSYTQLSPEHEKKWKTKFEITKPREKKSIVVCYERMEMCGVSSQLPIFIIYIFLWMCLRMNELCVHRVFYLIRSQSMINLFISLFFHLQLICNTQTDPSVCFSYDFTWNEIVENWNEMAR